MVDAQSERLDPSAARYEPRSRAACFWRARESLVEVRASSLGRGRAIAAALDYCPLGSLMDRVRSLKDHLDLDPSRQTARPRGCFGEVAWRRGSWRLGAQRLH